MNLDYGANFKLELIHLAEHVRQPNVVLADGHAEPVDAGHLAGDDGADCGVANFVPASQGPAKYFYAFCK